ncbi:hypothetical protein V5P93_003916 [Actinokineospora auranticolor]|uniref:NACHT domain-containing protein n=1 Tax=Actinokineospora auranticolor TaxID=155976 RepID=A0A2S6GLV3_9PSEU|nr:hypothetical protein [Actinokineospora auranticolor]PPK66197.1 hypothetical protein CLV40_111161 [Actinokineospora auranticolor]
MTGGGRSGFWYAAGAAVCVAVAAAFGWGQLPRAQVGQVDPASLVVALAALAVGLLSARQAVRVARSTPVPVAEVAARLADEVRKREGAARSQLLGGGGRTIDVDFYFRAAPAHDAHHADAAGSLEQVVAYYQALSPQRLVITGAPGAGKTVLALELLDGLLDVREPDGPVPVRIPAAAWDTTHPLRDWLVHHVVDAYGLSERAARAVVDAGLVMPVIDGLDEMDATPAPGYTSRAAEAIRAVNAYQHGRRAAPLVLTCRTTHYQALTDINVWTHDAAHIAIRPVDQAKADRFIRSRVDDPDRWEPVLYTIAHHPGGPLAVGLSTPWRLSLATTVYEHRHPDTGAYLREPADLVTIATTGTSNAVRDHLLGHFVPATTATVTDQRYTAEQVQRWLGVLAAHLDHNATTSASLDGVPLSGTDLVLHHLWPLAGITRVRLATLGILALTWLLATPLLLVRNEIGFSQNHVVDAGAGMIAVAVGVSHVWGELWPAPVHLDLHQLRSREGRRRLVFGLVFGLVIGLVSVFVVGFADGLADGLLFVVAFVFASGLVVGLGPVFEPAARTGDPRGIVRRDLAVAAAVAPNPDPGGPLPDRRPEATSRRGHEPSPCHHPAGAPA